MNLAEALQKLEPGGRFKRFRVIYKDPISGKKNTILLNALSKDAIKVAMHGTEIVSIKEVKVK